MVKKLLNLTMAVFLLSNMGYAQELQKENNSPMPAGSRAMWDLEFWFDLPGNYHSGIATDGINFYTTFHTGGEFFRYNMDGSNQQPFTIPGVSKVRDFAYDGEYFYAVNYSTPFIYKLNLADGTYVGGIPVYYPGFFGDGSPTAIAYDPNLDDGNGGFWISEYFNLGPISMTGTPLVTPCISMGWDILSGIAYDPYSDPLNPCLWLFFQGNATFKQWDINTMSFTGITHSCHFDNPYFESISYSQSQGAFAYNNGAGKFLLAATVVSSSPVIAMVYELCDIALPAAPGSVTDLTVIPDTSGELNAELRWTNPVLTDGGGILTQLNAIKIYKNEDLIHTISDPEIGGTETYTVNVTEEGEYTYNVVAENSFGESLPSIVVTWIGHDVPAGPAEVTLIKNGTIAELSWTAVTTGLHNVYFTTTGLTYDIIRYPDEVVVETDLTVLTFSESIEPLQGYYYYRVIAKNDFGEGGYTDSNVGVFCNVKTLPFFEGFEDNGIKFPVCWEQEFVAQNREWRIYETAAAIEGNKTAALTISIINTEITKLITPPLNISGDDNFVLSFWMSAMSTHNADILRVYYKNSAFGEWNLLKEYVAEFFGWDPIVNWKKRTIALPEGTDDYFIAFEVQVNAYGIMLDAVSVFDARIATGRVTDMYGPVEGAKVEVIGTEYFDYTDEEGNYDILDIEEGVYNFTVSKLGYYDKTEQVTIEGYVTEKDFVLTHLPLYSVSGKVTGSDAPDGLEGVSVTLSGYNTYTTTTDEFGDYLFEDVFGEKIFDIKAFKVGYLKYFSTIDLDDDVSYDFNLVESANPVRKPIANDNANSVNISWEEPLFGTSDKYRFDSGIVNGQFGFSGSPAPYGVVGTCHRVNATLEKIQWFLTDEGGIQDVTNVFIFDLDEQGMPTKNIIFSALNVPTSVMKWSEYEFPTPVHTPNGFYMALSRSIGTYLSLGYSEATEDWPYQHNTHYSCLNYTSLLGYVLVSQSYNGNLMLRAEGYLLGEEIIFGYPIVTTSVKLIEEIDIHPVFIPSEPFKTEDPSLIGGKSLQNYKVYRLFDGQQNDDTKWTMLDGNVNGLSYTDNAWGTMGEGVYLWGVKAEYTSNNISVPRLTNKLVKGMQYTFTVNLTTNSDDPVTGAVIKLTNQDGNPEHIFTKTATGNVVTIDLVWKGTYDISIELKNFYPYTVTDYVIDMEGLSIDVDLEEITKPIINPVAEIVGENVKISWYEPIPDINKWFKHCINDVIFGRVGYGEDEGNDLTAAMRFTPADLDNLGIVSGHAITKVALGVGTEMEFINLMEIRIWEGGSSVTSAGQLVYTQPITNYTSFAETAMNEVILTTPYIIDASKELRIGYRVVNTKGYPLGRDAGPIVSQKGGLFLCPVLNNGQWVELTLYGVNANFSIKAYVTSDEEFIGKKSDIELSSKSMTGYTVYRLEQEQIEDEWTLLSDNVTGLTYTDSYWNMLSGGIYQWAIKANYTSGQSDAKITNALEKQVGIRGNSLSNVVIYPNPASDELRITNYELRDGLLSRTLSAVEVEIFDVYGRNVVGAYGKRPKTEHPNEIIFDISHLVNGVYFVVIESITGEKEVFKMVKK